MIARAIRSPRCCTSAKHGDQGHNVRVNRDQAKSLAKQALGDDETYLPEDVGAFIPTARLRRTYGAGGLKMRSVVSPNACRTIGPISPAGKRPRKAKVLAQPPDSRRAPADCIRGAKPLQCPEIELLHVVTGPFVCDVFRGASRKAAMGGFYAFPQLGLIFELPPQFSK